MKISTESILSIGISFFYDDDKQGERRKGRKKNENEVLKSLYNLGGFIK